MMTQEKSLKARMLMVRYQRGLIYLRAHDLEKDFDKLDTWLFDNFQVKYRTATAYMAVSQLINKFPLLIRAGLTFDQMRRHLTRIEKYCETHLGFDETCCVVADASEATIEPDPSAVTVCDYASLDADFEFVVNSEDKEETFACFEKLTNPTSADS